MDGPWTQYAAPSAPPPGPWMKYAAPSDAAAPMTVQQMYGGTGTQAQPLAGAVTNAIGQGVVQGVGSAIAGTGRAITGAAARGTEGQLAAMDAIDAGKDVPADQDVIGYGSMSPEQRAKMRADFTAAEPGLAAREPNALTRAGMAVEGAAPGMFQVDPAQEGHLTNIGRIVGGFAPIAAASTFGGPAGMLASAAAVAGQAYDGTYQDAIAHGATHDEADAAAGKSAAAQMSAMSLPIGRVMQLVPTALREGFAKTLVNLGQNGVEIAGKGAELAGRGAELGAGNSLATLAQHYVASQTYDPGRPLMPGTGDAALDGFLAGLVIHAPGAVVGGRTVAPTAAADAVMKAPDVDAAIDAATQAVAPGAWTTSTAPQPASAYGEAPAFVPPATPPLVLPRILELIRQDNAAAATRPAFVPPDARQPTWGELLAQRPDAANDDLNQPANSNVQQGAVPQSVGSAASRDNTPQAQIDLSTADMKANRRVAEMNELLAPPQAGDNTIYVDGSFPTLAERSGDPAVSQTENLLRQRNPTTFVGDGKPLTENNRARVNAYDAETVPDTTLNSMRRARDAQWAADSEAILPTAKPADLSPVLDWVDGELDNPRIQENDAVRSVLADFRSRLIDQDGNLKTDPAAVWGIHDNLQNQLAKAKDPLNMTGSEKFAESQIIQAKKLIDQAMNVATDNRFQTATENYAKASQAINSGVLLNDFRPKLTNMAGDLQAANFHRFVVGLAKERGDPGIDPSMDISDETMRSLINIDNDLKRAGLIRLGSAAGSPTNLLGALAGRLGIDGAHTLLGAVPGVGHMIKAGKELYDQRQLEKLTAQHLAPPEGGYVYPNAP